jgi:peptidoglycan/LPS O-acetylase OafA/YrhL
LGGAVVAAGALQALADYPAHSPLHGWTIASALHWFLTGFILADLHVSGDLRQAGATVAWDVAGGLAWTMLLAGLLQDWDMHVFGPPLILVAYAAAFKGGVWPKLLSIPAVYLLGGMCYTIYLYHSMLKAAFGKVTIALHAGGMLGVDAAIQIVVLGALIVACSACLFVAFEKPFMSRGLFERVRRALGGPEGFGNA